MDAWSEPEASMALQFGELGFPSQWLHGVLVAMNRELDDPILITLKTFIELVNDPTISLTEKT